MLAITYYLVVKTGYYLSKLAHSFVDKSEWNGMI